MSIFEMYVNIQSVFYLAGCSAINLGNRSQKIDTLSLRNIFDISALRVGRG